jgi:hypothetical protein
MEAAAVTARIIATPPKGRAMKESFIDHLKDFLTLALIGLGISLPAHDYLGGMFLALAGATFALRADPERDERELWVTILGAFLVSHIAAIAAARWLPGMPVQLVMASAGFASRRIVRWTYRALGVVEKRADRITDQIMDRVLPDDKGDKP